jgi:EAL domain-containing protein (putative c-di-GMP-specific phosphodiesterase class I)
MSPNESQLCRRCEVLPKKLAGDYDLYLSAPVRGTADKLREVLESEGLSVSTVDDLITVSLSKEALDGLSKTIFETLTEGELGATRVLSTEAGSQPSLSDFIHMQTLETLIARLRGESVTKILEAGRLETFVHPIIRSGSDNEIFAYECLTRGRDEEGNLVSPGFLFDVARKADLLFYLDREARTSALRNAAALAGRAKLFVNFNPSTIYTPEYCLQTTFAALDEAGLNREDVVFEVVESDKIDDTEHLLTILQHYRDRGFEVALDDLGSGYNSLTSLSQLRPDYMKLDIELVRDVDRDPFKETIVRNLLVLARDLGIQTIAEGIEREGEYEWIKNAGADFVQGYYFAKPAPSAEVIKSVLES